MKINTRGQFIKGDSPWNKGIEFKQISGEKHYLWKDRVKKKCLFCEREFEVRKYRKDSAKYCSRKCKDSDPGGHLPNSGSFKKGHSAPKTAFEKGLIPWNKNKKGVMPIPWNKGIKWLERRGENHHLWKGGKPKKSRNEVLTFEEDFL